MKRLGLILAVLCFVSGWAVGQTNEVTSVNVVGYYKLTIPSAGAYTLCALNLDAIDPTNRNVVGIFGTQLRSGSSPFSADKLYFFNPSTVAYQSFARKTADGQYYNTGAWSTSAATNPAIVSGVGFWLQSSTSATTNYDLTIMGEAVPVATQQVSVVAGYQLLGNLFSSDLNLATTGLKTQGTAGASQFTCDKILVYNNSSYQTYGLKSDGWHSTTNFSGPALSNAIPMGSGFWYYKVGSSGFTWVETNSYLGNLR